MKNKALIVSLLALLLGICVIVYGTKQRSELGFSSGRWSSGSTGYSASFLTITHEWSRDIPGGTPVRMIPDDVGYDIRYQTTNGIIQEKVPARNKRGLHWTPVYKDPEVTSFRLRIADDSSAREARVLLYIPPKVFMN